MTSFRFALPLLFSFAALTIFTLSACVDIKSQQSTEVIINNDTPINTAIINCQVGSESNGKYLSPLPLPSSLPLVDYERKLYPWIMKRKYAGLNWCHDKEIRDTGPFVNGLYHGTHPAVLIYYSPEVMQWLIDRENGIESEIPDGAVIVKEMYYPPAQIYQDIKRVKDEKEYEKIRIQQLSDWTVMIKDSKASADGWFWGSVSAPSVVNGKMQTFNEALEAQLDTRKNNNKPGSYVYKHGVRLSGFGMPCLRCHASAKNELTFSSLRNIKGFESEGAPIEFLDDGSWRTAIYFKKYPQNQLLKDPELKSIFDISEHQLPWVTQAAINKNIKKAKIDEHDRELSDSSNVSPSSSTQQYVNKTVLKYFPEIPKQQRNQVKKFPQQWLDHVVQKTGKPQDYVTSDNCIGCHGGLSDDTFGVSMFIPTGPGAGEGYDISEYGEWRWSPMGLAGRDPIFHAQLESEMAILVENGKNPEASGLKGSVKATQEAVTNTCLSCHGAMGQRQLNMDAQSNPHLDANFKSEYFYMTEQLESSEKQTEAEKKYHMYGELGRDGISCMICHRIDAPNPEAVKNWNPHSEQHWVNPDIPDKGLAYLLFHNNTGHFDKTPSDKLNGPYDVIKKPMEHVLNIKPEKNEFIKDSQMCGTCHTINLPNIGSTDTSLPVLQAAEPNPAFKDYPHSIEQATFLEWQNSAFASGDTFKSCQDCHMKSSFESLDGKVKIDNLKTKIATIEDSTYPEADHTLDQNELEVPLRKDYKRHTHVGLNGFLLNMFKQFDDILGVAETSYMTGATNPGVDLALDSMVLQAQRETVDMSIDELKFDGDMLVANVTARNKVGHRFPSGVAFRRGFIELLVLDGEKVIWGSGQTNDAGIIVDNNGDPLVTEFLPSSKEFGGDCEYLGTNPVGCYQPHHQVITSDQQVQIYEELNQNKDKEFTTSFIHRVHLIKDNRLLPDGWRVSSTFKDQGQVMLQFMEATDPHFVGNDPDYQDQGPSFKGKDSLKYKIKLPKKYKGKKLRVKATMYFQAIPPYWLKQRFTLAPNGEATKRLHYLVSHLDLNDTPLEQWKFKINTAEKSINM